MRCKNTAFLLFISLFLFLALQVSGFAIVKQNSIPVSNIEDLKVVPVGKSVGITMSMNGVLVVGVSEMIDTDNNKCSPSKEAGIKPGDVIKSIDGVEVDNVETLNKCVKSSEGNKISVVINRVGKTIDAVITPKLSKDSGEYKIGSWVKDAASGIGTMTFYDPATKRFGALGHGITDVQTGKVIDMLKGDVLNATIVSTKKGEKGSPGELKGVFVEDKYNIGSIERNNEFGLFGKISSPDFVNEINEPISVAKREDVQLGPAYILANVEGDRVEKFDVEIQKIMDQNSESSKGMVIKVTDNRLIEKTGGIIQGMSGSPIIQNDKIVGAVTHVFVNDPTKGYGIFIEWMLENTQQIA